MIDRPGRVPPRFSADKEPLAAAAIQAKLERLERPGPKRVLALDGGIRGVITLGFLERIETLLRDRRQARGYPQHLAALQSSQGEIRIGQSPTAAAQRRPCQHRGAGVLQARAV
jgi:hypothetical protein